jgi:hypothetical protein
MLAVKKGPKAAPGAIWFALRKPGPEIFAPPLRKAILSL